MTSQPHTAWDITKATWERFTDHGAMLAAAVAYYTVLSVVPLIMIAVSVAALVFDEELARQQLMATVQRNTSPAVGSVVEQLLSSARHPSTQTAAVLAMFVLGWAASRFFAQVQEALNLIWGVRVRKGRGAWLSARRYLIKRVVSFAMVLGCGALLLASLVLQTVLSVFGTWVARWLEVEISFVLLALQRLASFLLLTLLFALIFRILPDAVVRLRDVWPGAVVTTALTLLGTWLLSSYVSIVGPAWLQGSIGSIAAFMLWAYYLGQVFFLGAAFTRVWSGERKGSIEPEPYAELVSTS